MAIDYEKWKEGEGYDLAALAEASPEERDQIEALLLSRPVDDWRDVEALSQFNSPRAKAALKKAGTKGDTRVKLAVMQHTKPSDKKRIETLKEALETGVVYGGLTQALMEVEDFHPPEIVDALWEGVVKREGDVAFHFATMLLFIHGKIDSPYDDSQRKLCLRLNTEDKAEREAALQDLKKLIAA